MRESVKNQPKNQNRENSAKSSTHRTRKSRSSVKSSLQKTHAKILGSYYGNPAKNLQIIAITGTTGKLTVAHFVHEILRAAGEPVAAIFNDAPFSVRTLHKFLSDASKAGAKYAVVTVPAEGLRDNIFYGLPITIAAMTDFLTAGLNDMTPDEYIESEQTLFAMHPATTVLNADDARFSDFQQFRGTKETLIYGQSGDDVKILSSKLYPKGTEATLAIRGDVITVASFLTGETTVSYMAAAAAIAYGLEITSSYIIDVIANYDPE